MKSTSAIGKIVHLAAQEWGILEIEILEKGRKANVDEARNAVMYVAKTVLRGRTWRSIGTELCRDKTTVKNGFNRTKDLMSVYPKFRERIKQFEDRVRWRIGA